MFSHLREIDGFSIASLQQSLNPELRENVKRIFKAGEGMGKSGSFFFFSHDNKFLIKTMTSGDFAAFMKLFSFYHEHVATNPRSLLARIYGVYSVKIDQQAPVYLILMGNTAQCQDSRVLHKFDLKGSIVKRLVHLPKGASKHSNSAVLKDQNLLELKKSEVFL